jgi:hypothetical protein
MSEKIKLSCYKCKKEFTRTVYPSKGLSNNQFCSKYCQLSYITKDMIIVDFIKYQNKYQQLPTKHNY